VAKDSSQPSAKGDRIRAAWVPMDMEYLGNAAQLIRVGGGKLTPAGGDPGENRKQSPTG
jgi:hypothetical protein